MEAPERRCNWLVGEFPFVCVARPPSRTEVYISAVVLVNLARYRREGRLGCCAQTIEPRKARLPGKEYGCPPGRGKSSVVGYLTVVWKRRSIGGEEQRRGTRPFEAATGRLNDVGRDLCKATTGRINGDSILNRRQMREWTSGQRAAGSRQRAEDRGQRAAGSRQRAEGSRQWAAGSRMLHQPAVRARRPFADVAGRHSMRDNGRTGLRRRPLADVASRHSMRDNGRTGRRVTAASGRHQSTQHARRHLLSESCVVRSSLGTRARENADNTQD